MYDTQRVRWNEKGSCCSGKQDVVLHQIRVLPLFWEQNQSDKEHNICKMLPLF